MMTPRSFVVLLSAVLALVGASSQLARAAEKPVLLYSRYFNAKGETRYLPDGTYKDVLDKLRASYDVRVSDAPLNAESLKGVNVVLIANPSEKAVGGDNPPPHHCTPEDVSALFAYVRAGGAVIAMGNQENHNLETEKFNVLLGAFGMKWEPRYTDAKQLVLPKSLPAIGGLRWAYYTGNTIVLSSTGEAKASLVVHNDLGQKPQKAPRDEAGVLLAGVDLGKGRFIAITDAGWISNDALSGKGIGGVAITEHDNWEIFARLVRWATHGD